jgi:hypothetical protein
MRTGQDFAQPAADRAGRLSARGFFTALLICGLTGSALLRGRIDRAAAAEYSPTPYVGSGETLRRFSLGYEGLLANVYWTRVIQYFGHDRMTGRSTFDLLGPLLRTTVTLDPHLLIAYRFGAIFLAGKPPSGAARPEEALDLIRRGIAANPEYWPLWQDLGFVYYWDLKDYSHAALAFEAGSRQPGAGVWMKTLAAAVAARGGEVETSRLLWSEVLRESGNETIRRGALDHLAAIQAEEDISRTNRALEVFRQRTGHPASGLADLSAAGLLPPEPTDPSGTPYVLGMDGKAALGPGSTINLDLAR